MTMGERWAEAKVKLKYCNYFIAGVIMAMIGAWEEIKPMLQEFLSRFIDPSNVSTVLIGFGLIVAIVRAGAILRKPAPVPEEKG